MDGALQSLILEDYEKAIFDFSNEITNSGNDEALLYRGISYCKNMNHKFALADLSLYSKVHTNNYHCLFWMGVAHFNNGNLQNSLNSFNIALSLAKSDKQKSETTTWINRIDAEKNCTIPIYIPPVENIVITEPSKKPEPEPKEKYVEEEKKSPISKPLSYNWSQTVEEVIIEFLFKNITEDKFFLSQTPRQIAVRIEKDKDSEADFEFDLFDEIVTESTKKIFKEDFIEVRLTKKNKSLLWKELEIVKYKSQVPTSYSSSGKSKDWSKIGSDMREEDEWESARNPMKVLFKKMYDNAKDDDERRALTKSFVQSGGTTL